MDGAAQSQSRSVMPKRSRVSKGMGMGAGGNMKQEILADPYGFEVWDREAAPTSERRVFVNLANSALWRQITGQLPPHHPITAEMAQRHGFP